MVKYERFEIHMEPRSLHRLAELIREHEPNSHAVVNAELHNFACEIEARLQKIAVPPRKSPQDDDSWLL